MAVLANLSLLGLGLIALLAWGFSRVLDGPKWAGQAIALVVVLIMLAGQLLLPVSAPFRQSVTGSIELLALIALLAVPVLGYRWVLRRARRINAPAAPEVAGITGQAVLIPDPRALALDLAETLGTPTTGKDDFGLIFRDTDGTLLAGLVARASPASLLVGPVWWQVGEGGSRALTPLIDALETTASDNGHRRILVETTQTTAAAFAARGYSRIDLGAASPTNLLGKALR